jgi:hypothetical protein
VTTPLDITPFGFTATENLVYNRLLTGGPSSGYAVSRDLLVARANVYQALRGLVAKEAAVSVGQDPQRFRAVKPSDVYAAILKRENGKLDVLESQLRAVPDLGAESFIRIENERAFLDLVTRTGARERGPVRLLVPTRLLNPLIPVLRKRLADAVDTEIWVLGEGADPPVPITGRIPMPRVEAAFGSPIVAFLARDAALLARVEAGTLAGYWASDLAVLGATRAAINALTATT